MKNIENKNVEINREGEMPVKATYGAWIKAAINNPPKDGFTVDDIRWRLNVDAAIRNSINYIDLEDAEFAKVKQCVNEMKWGITAQEIVDFVDYINGL